MCMLKYPMGSKPVSAHYYVWDMASLNDNSAYNNVAGPSDIGPLVPQLCESLWWIVQILFWLWPDSNKIKISANYLNKSPYIQF